MLRILLSVLIVLHSSVASAIVFTPKYQRRAMSRLVSNFSSSLSKSEQRRIYDTLLTAGRAEDREAKHALLDSLAVDLVEATSRFVLAAREDRFEETRETLRDVMVQLVRAAGTSTVFSSDESTHFGCNLYALVGFPSFVTWGVTALAATPLHLGDTALSVGGWAGATFLASLMSGLVMALFQFHVPGTTRAAHMLGGSDGIDVYWRKVGKWMGADAVLSEFQVKNVEDFRALLERELRGVTLDQACTNALLSIPTERHPEESHDS